jgi:hypothetical protein
MIYSALTLQQIRGVDEPGVRPIKHEVSSGEAPGPGGEIRRPEPDFPAQLAIVIALRAAVTLTGGEPVAFWHLTEAVPEGPAACIGTDAVLVSPAVPSVSIVIVRVSVFEPTVRMQVTLTCCRVALLTTLAVGLARARYELPAASATAVTVVGVEATLAVLLVVPV